MKEITRISLAALPYNVDVDAQKLLDKYLRDIEHALGADADAMKEIESRIAELLADRGVAGEKVITKADVEAVKEQLGAPADFIDESVIDEQCQDVSLRGEKKLYRDLNAEVLGGVCAGLAAYFHVDVVWMRLLAVVLTPLTSGVMILIYLTAWAIMPPARTAAERLQMKGSPVTLEALQEESATTGDGRDNAGVALKIIRILTGIGFLVTAAIVMMGIGAALFYLMTGGKLVALSYGERVIAGLFGLAASAFVVFCFVVARSLFINRYSNRFWIILGILSVIGLGSFATGSFGAHNINTATQAEQQRSTVTTQVDAAKLEGVKELVIESNLNSVRYVVTASAPKIELTYNHHTLVDKPLVTLERTNDTVTFIAKAKTSDRAGIRYAQPSLVTIYGPALTQVRNQLGNLTYETMGQDELTIHGSRQASTELVGTKPIQHLSATIEGASLRFEDANVVNVILVADSGSSVQIGNVANVEATVPESCPTDRQFDLRINHATSVMINGTKLTERERQTPCMNVMVHDGN